MSVLRSIVGYFVMGLFTAFIVSWDIGLLLLYGCLGFSNLLEVVGTIMFLGVSFVALWVLDLICTKILPENSLNLRSIFFELFD